MRVTAGRRVASPDGIQRAGDYTGSFPEHDRDGSPNGVTGVWFLLPVHQGETPFDRPAPGSGLHRVSSPPWDLRECPDGSLEIRPSIACGRGSPDGEYWHGYLDEGHQWRQA